MEVVRLDAPLAMGGCLECHRDPASRLRPKSELTNMSWKPENDQETLGRDLIKAHQIPVQRLSDCYTCHR